MICQYNNRIDKNNATSSKYTDEIALFISTNGITSLKTKPASGIRTTYMRTKTRSGKNGYDRPTGLETRAISVGICGGR